MGAKDTINVTDKGISLVKQWSRKGIWQASIYSRHDKHWKTFIYKQPVSNYQLYKITYHLLDGLWIYYLFLTFWCNELKKTQLNNY